MNIIELDLSNCFGISQLKHVFDFSKSNTCVVYASNGVMKTSFANTFQELSKGNLPKDKLFNKPSKFKIQIDSIHIKAEEILVVKSFEGINSTFSQTKLLVDENSKSEYDSIYTNIIDQKNKLIVDLNRKSGVAKKDLEDILLADFNAINIFDLFKYLLRQNPETDYSQLKYIDLFNQDVIDFLSKPKIKDKIEEYFQTYNSLIENSTMFKRGVFNPGRADVVSQTLNKENYFHANHKILLDGDKSPIDNIQQLNARLLEEKKAIIDNEDLLKIEQEIKKVAVKQLRDILENNPIVAEYNNITEFKRKVWLSYLFELNFSLTELCDTYDNSKKRLSEIEETAKNQETEWDIITKKFNERFFVPFKATITNKESSILGKAVPNIAFVFEDTYGTPKTLGSDELNREDILSQGEKRAMYLLNVLFNIEAKRKERLNTLLIIDDIADSFDYKNKYAIIQYLIDIQNENSFKQIILTHNYDFFRTIQSRLLGEEFKRDCSFMALKDEDKIELIKTGTKSDTNPFEEWKKKLDNPLLLVASIPFVRNLVEFKEGKSSSEFKILTSLLHIKADSDTISISQIKSIFDKTITSYGLDVYNPEDTLKSIMDNEVNRLMQNPIPLGINLEEKIVISLAIRLKAENYILSKITDKSEIKGNQTGKLFGRFKSEFIGIKDTEIKVLDRVNLITPENIHVNSFMFEPIIDLSLDHLIQLYKDLELLA